MRREQVTLMMLATAEGGEFTPVQIQKALFLLSREAADLFTDGSHYNFRPYDYGPFDRAVYSDLDDHIRTGSAEQVNGWVRRYRATPNGTARGAELLAQLPQEQQNFIRDVSTFVRSQSFSDLVSSIYQAYPEMRANSIFVGE